MPDGVEGSLQIGVDHLVKVVFLHPCHQIISGNSRIVHQDIHPSEIRKHLLHHFSAGVVIRNRALINLRPASHRTDLLRRFLSPFFAAMIVNRHICPFFSQRQRDLLSNSPARPGYQGHFSFQHFNLHSGA